MTKVQFIKGAYIWQSGFAVDGDGAPKCYCWPGYGLPALDYIGNAGSYAKGWYGVVINSGGNPVVQGPNDPAPGYLVSTTALHDPSKAATDPYRYVDASTIPYVAIPPDIMGAHESRMGDVAMVLYNGKQCGAICADVSPKGHFGEGSIALAEALGIPSSPKDGGCDSSVTWLVFPGLTCGWPVATKFFQAAAQKRFDDWGGKVSVKAIMDQDNT